MLVIYRSASLSGAQTSIQSQRKLRDGGTVKNMHCSDKGPGFSSHVGQLTTHSSCRDTTNPFFDLLA